MLGLEWSRVDLERQIVYLGASDQKNGKTGSVPLNREAQAALLSRMRFRERYCPDSPWVFCDTDGQRIARVKKSFATAEERAGGPASGQMRGNGCFIDMTGHSTSSSD